MELMKKERNTSKNNANPNSSQSARELMKKERNTSKNNANPNSSQSARERFQSACKLARTIASEDCISPFEEVIRAKNNHNILHMQKALIRGQHSDAVQKLADEYANLRPKLSSDKALEKLEKKQRKSLCIITTNDRKRKTSIFFPNGQVWEKYKALEAAHKALSTEQKIQIVNEELTRPLEKLRQAISCGAIILQTRFSINEPHSEAAETLLRGAAKHFTGHFKDALMPSCLHKYALLHKDRPNLSPFMIVEDAIERGINTIEINGPNTKRAAQILRYVTRYAKNIHTKNLVFALHRLYNFFALKINHTAPLREAKDKLIQVGELEPEPELPPYPIRNNLNTPTSILPISTAANELLSKYYIFREDSNPAEAFQRLRKQQNEICAQTYEKREKRKATHYQIERKQKEIIEKLKNNQNLKSIPDATLIKLQELSYILSIIDDKNKEGLAEHLTVNDLAEHLTEQGLANLQEAINILPGDELHGLFGENTEHIREIINTLQNNQSNYVTPNITDEDLNNLEDVSFVTASLEKEELDEWKEANKKLVDLQKKLPSLQETNDCNLMVSMQMEQLIKDQNTHPYNHERATEWFENYRTPNRNRATRWLGHLETYAKETNQKITYETLKQFLFADIQ